MTGWRLTCVYLSFPYLNLTLHIEKRRHGVAPRS